MFFFKKIKIQDNLGEKKIKKTAEKATFPHMF